MERIRIDEKPSGLESRFLGRTKESYNHLERKFRIEELDRENRGRGRTLDLLGRIYTEQR